MRTLAIATLAWVLTATLVEVEPIHAQGVTQEDALGVTVLASGDTVAFGGAAQQYHEPAFQIQQADFTHTVVFIGILQNPYSFYQLQQSFDEMNWSAVFAPGLEPDPTGVIVFHDSMPSEQMFYRLYISTETQRTFTVRNPGATALTDVQVTVDGEESGLFQVNSTELPAVLPPDVSASFVVNYIADDAAERTVELRISSNLAEPFVLILAGGVAPLPPPPPIITRQPQGLSVPSGQSATLTVQAVGASLEYQWYAGESGDTSAAIEGATGPAYTTPTLSSAASFWVRVSDANELTTASQTATVTVQTPPVIVEQPISQTIISGQSANLLVAATGAEPLEYQWYAGESGDTSAPIEGATESAYTTPALSATASFWVRISDANELTADSQTATVTVQTPPVVVEQPTSQSIVSGQSAILSVEATGAEPLEYQWYAGESGDTSAPIEGATQPTYTTPALSATASFWVRVSDANELTADSQTATVTVTALTPPVIVEQPSSQSVTSGETATLTVVATGTEPLEYQWYAGESGDTSNPIEGATESSYTTPALTADASFWVRVSDANELTTDSQTATVTVLTPEPAVLNAVEIRDGNLRLTITGPIGSRWRVWRSTDLIAWEPAEELEVIELVDGEAAIEIPLLEVPSAFHRLVQEP